MACLTMPGAAGAAKCVVVVLPPGGWGELAPQTRAALLPIALDGAAGSLSCAVPRPMAEASAWVTLGAGNRAVWPSESGSPTSLALRDPVGRARFVERLRAANSRLPYPVEVGSLGQTLRAGGYRTGIVGLQELWQVAAVMDAEGKVDLATVAATPAALQRALKRADYIVVNAAAAEGDAGVAKVLSAARALPPEDLLIVAALAPKDAPFVGLTPVIVRGPTSAQSLCRLVSPTTRRPGVVANIDLAPTILQHFDLPAPPSYRNGAPMGLSKRLSLSLREAINLDVRGRRASALQRYFVPVCFLLQAVLVPLSIIRRWPANPSLRAALMVWLLFVPAASYAVGVMPLSWPNPAWLGAALAVAALPGLVPFLLRRLAPSTLAGYAFAAAAAVIVILIADQSAGAPLQPIVPVGYSLGFGGRFYGIGNEAAGLLMAAGAIAASLIFSVSRATDSPSRWLRQGVAVLLACSPVVVIAHPNLGANAGATLSSIVCMGALLIAALRLRRKWPWAVVVVGGAFAVLVLVAHVDATRDPERMSHIGRAWLRLSGEGLPYLSELARRKVTTAVNTMRLLPALLPVSLWVLFWSYALLRPLGFVRRVYQAMPAVRPPLKAIAVAGLAAALLNDSGVTTPTMMLDLALPLLGLAALAKVDGTPPVEVTESDG